MFAQTVTAVYDLKSYRLNNKDDDTEEEEEECKEKQTSSTSNSEFDRSYHKRIERLRDRFVQSKEEGPITTTQLVMLAHKHNHLFLFLLKDRENNYTLPTPSSIACINDDVDDDDDDEDDEDEDGNSSSRKLAVPVKELVSQWWRSHFDDNLYPYVPVHIAVPVEHVKVQLAELPRKCRIVYVESGDEDVDISSGSDNNNSEGMGPESKKRKTEDGSTKTKKGSKKTVIAVPFYDVFANEKRFGPVIASLPQILSCFNLSYK